MWVPLGTLRGLRKPHPDQHPRRVCPPPPRHRATPPPPAAAPGRWPVPGESRGRNRSRGSRPCGPRPWEGGRGKGRAWVCEARGCGTSAGGRACAVCSPPCCAPRTHSSVAALAPQSRLVPPQIPGRGGRGHEHGRRLSAHRAAAALRAQAKRCRPGLLGCPDALAAEGNRGAPTARGDRADAHLACDTAGRHALTGSPPCAPAHRPLGSP